MRSSASNESGLLPLEARGWADRAVEAATAREWGIALEAIERAMELGWDNPMAHGGLGWVLNELGRYDEAIHPLERALERCQDPRGQSWLHTSLGFSHARRNDHGRALEHYRIAMEADPDNALAYQNAGFELAKAEKYADAVQHLETAARLAPEDEDTWYTLGSVLSHVGELEHAADALRRSIALGRRDGKAHAELAAVLQRQCRFSDAAGMAARALRRHLPRDWRTWIAHIANDCRKQKR